MLEVDPKKPETVTFPALEGDLSILGQRSFHVPQLGRDLLMVVRATGGLNLKPNWPRIMAQALGISEAEFAIFGTEAAAASRSRFVVALLKALAKSRGATAIAGRAGAAAAVAGGKAAGSALVAAAPVALPIAAAAALVYGYVDSQKAGTAIQEAVRDGKVLRKWLRFRGDRLRQDPTPRP